MAEELREEAEELLDHLRRKQPFQSDWDTAAFVVIFAFIGTVLLLTALAFLHCCCCCSCCCLGPTGATRHRAQRAKVGVDNLGMIP
ncbi:small integral membrane protein 22 [Ornithorhynchus anatinus]|uniref:small integral membrane protein 22 n=1 Tax=Ornithorhynchus anatinus TaxID=9258 RepID=UPI0010A889F1|nr:small integral membrane protein 22 [Ornithorhynchus anatinus]